MKRDVENNDLGVFVLFAPVDETLELLSIIGNTCQMSVKITIGGSHVLDGL